MSPTAGSEPTKAGYRQKSWLSLPLTATSICGRVANKPAFLNHFPQPLQQTPTTFLRLRSLRKKLDNWLFLERVSVAGIKSWLKSWLHPGGGLCDR